MDVRRRSAHALSRKQKREEAAGPAYLRIAETLHQDIKLRALQPDTRLGSQQEFARRFEVSSITIEAALRELQERGIVYRMRGKGTYVARRAPVEPGTLRIGVVGHEQTNWEMNLYVRDLFQSIQSYARDNACYVRYVEKEADYATLLEDRIVDGLVLITPSLESLKASGLDPKRHAYTVIGADYPEHPSVTIDNKAMVRTALEHLASLGHRDIALLTDPLTYWDTSQRWEAFRDFHALHGWMMRPDWVVNWPGWWINEPQDEERFYTLLCGRQRPSAVLALGSFFGTDALRIMESHGIGIPGQMSIMGLDLPTFGTPGRERLTTMLQPTQDIGTQAIQQVWDQIRHVEVPMKYVLPCSLRLGSTTAPHAPQT